MKLLDIGVVNLFGLESVISAYRVATFAQTTKRASCVADAFHSSVLGRSIDGPNTPGPRVNGEATPTVAHELIGRYYYIHAFVDGQGRDMAKRRGKRSEKFRLA